LEKGILRNNLLLREVYEAQYLEKEAQYDLLCSQIRPHFLYNALNTISLLVKCGENSDAVTAAEKLSVYLRGIMSSSHNIPLSSELKIIDAYLAFQRIRYRSKLQYHIDINERFLDYSLPALSLQPLVENAVVHGSEEVSSAVCIRIYTVSEQDSWIICVEDDAGGMSAEALEKLRERIACQNDESDENRFARNIGLVNVQKRIRLKYGMPYGIIIESEPGRGTLVMIRFPYIEPESGGNINV
ncbi:MAG: histidine kinase, partial [Oscillospiraceae bacterium]|nr:histidine kinase [Oscillospiraceae bacterium]